MRVAFVLRSAEVQPLFRDLCDVYVNIVVFGPVSASILSILPPPLIKIVSSL
jgi:hypothetical protein